MPIFYKVQKVTAPFGPKKELFLASSSQLPNSIPHRISNFDLFLGGRDKVIQWWGNGAQLV